MKDTYLFFPALAIKASVLFCLSTMVSTTASAQKTYYDANTGITLWAPNYHSITPNNGVFIILRSDQYASMGGVSMVWPFKQATTEQLKNALLSPMRFDGFNMSAVGRLETINGAQWGGYVSGVVQGSAVYGYMTAISDLASGRGAVWLHYYAEERSKNTAREAAIERSQMLKFDPPATTNGQGSAPAPVTDNQPSKPSGKAVAVQKVCTACAGVGSSLCYSCQGAGSKKSTNYRYTPNGMVMETSTLSCIMCSGTGRIQCHVCAGLGRKTEWEYKSEVVAAQSPKSTPLASNATKSAREQEAKNQFFKTSKSNGWAGKVFDKYSDQFKAGYKMTLRSGASDNTLVADYPTTSPCSSRLDFVKSEETSADNYDLTFQESVQTHKENCEDGLTVQLHYNQKNESVIEIKYYHKTLGLFSYGTLYRQ